MQIVRNKILVIAGCFMLFSIVACKKWVEDAPQPLQVDEEKVFATEQGFREVLNGVYLQMGAPELYGKDLTMGVLSVLGRSYDMNITPSLGNLYYQTTKYNLADPTVKTYSAQVWQKMYQAVANVNNLLANMDAKKSVFTADNYNTIKGEGLALRAFLHFDLLRLFAQAPAASGFSSDAIPYVKTIDVNSTPLSTVNQVLEQCIVDLNAADDLLNPNALTASKINKWAVKGLLARVYMYKGDIVKADEYAKAVINSNKFAWSKTSGDLMFSSEHLFNLNIYQNNYGIYYKSILTGSAALGLSTQRQDTLYVRGGGATSDSRKFFIDPATGFGGTTAFMPKKFNQILPNRPNVFPMIRLTEMYYIAAECAVNNGDAISATALLDTVRVHRSLPKYTLAAITIDSLNKEIRKEYQKEFIGEGQVFFYFKRKNMPYATLPFTKVPVVVNATYTFVKPE